MTYHQTWFLICLVPFALGSYGVIRTRLWRNMLFWLYFFMFPVLIFMGASLPEPEQRFWGGLAIALSILIAVNMVIFLIKRSKSFTFVELSSMFLFFPFIAYLWDRFGGHLIY
ncbi:hypothetical protein LJC26_06850 [Desulfovibrio sp. OttesenSCG-928-O18]|nr:hypothetical protein [Desulfovibrio sp. OttesenSCG-928-O18]